MTCKKCSKKLQNKRQIATTIDILLSWGAGLAVAIFCIVIYVAGGSRIDDGILSFLLLLGSIIAFLAFSFRDAIGGVSPGKALLGLRTIDAGTGQQATTGQSFKRNATLFWPYLLIFLFDILAGVLGGILFLIGSSQIGRGPRLGDKWANTRVVPKGMEKDFLA